jgi:hypothetical protein
MDDATATTPATRRRAAAVSEATERELAALRGQLLSAETALAEVPELREAAREAARLRDRVGLLARQLAEVVAELEARSAAVAERDAARAERDGLRGERDHLREVVEGLTGSVSWRVTAPLRRLRR